MRVILVAELDAFEEETFKKTMAKSLALFKPTEIYMKKEYNIEKLEPHNG